jgi:hypothetical protein
MAAKMSCPMSEPAVEFVMTARPAAMRERPVATGPSRCRAFWRGPPTIGEVIPVVEANGRAAAPAWSGE